MSDSEALVELVKQFQSYPENELLDMAASSNWALSTHQAVREVLKARGVAAPPLPPAPDSGWADPVRPAEKVDPEPQSTPVLPASSSGLGSISAAEAANLPLAELAQRISADDLAAGTSRTFVIEGDDAISSNFWAGSSVQYLCDRFPPTLGAEEVECVRELVPSWNPGGLRTEASPSDSAGPVAPEQADLGALLRAVSESLSRGDRRGLEEAKARVRPMLAAKPDLVEAAELLGLAQLGLREFKDAIETHATLAKASPDRALYHLRWGFALHGDEQLGEAAARYQRAMELNPDDVDAKCAWVDLQVDRGLFEEALAALGETASRSPGGDLLPALQRRKLEILLASSRLAEAWQEHERIQSALAGRDPGALHEWSSALASALPAKLLARGCVSQTNELLRRLRWLGPDEARLYPSGHPLELAALPGETRVWLAKRCAPVCVAEGDQVQIALSSVIPLVLWALALLWTVTGDERWGAGGAGLAVVLFVLAAVATAAAGRHAWDVIGSRFGSFTVLHPLYLLRGSLDRLSLWPCVAFMGAEVRSGAQVAAELKFASSGPRPVAVRILSNSPKEALVCVTVIDLLRRWALGRIATGSLEKEDVARQFPVEVLRNREPGQTVAPLWWRRTLVWSSGAIVLGLLLSLWAVGYNRGLADGVARKSAAIEAERRATQENAWRDLQAHPTLKAYRAYLDQATVRHQADAPLVAVELKNQLESRLATRPAKSRAVLLAMVEAILEKAPAVICLDYAGGGDRQAGTRVENALLVEFSDAIRKNRNSEKVLQAALDSTFGKDQIDVQRCSGSGQITVSLEAEGKPTGEVYALEEKDGFELAAMDIDWSLVVRLPGAEEPALRENGTIKSPSQVEVRLPHRSIQNLLKDEPNTYSKQEARAMVAMYLAQSREMANEKMADTMTQQVVRAAAIKLGLGESEIIKDRFGSPDEIYRLNRSSPEPRGKSQ